MNMTTEPKTKREAFVVSDDDHEVITKALQYLSQERGHRSPPKRSAMLRDATLTWAEEIIKRHEQPDLFDKK